MSTESIPVDADKQAIEAVVAAYMAGVERCDGAGLAAIFAPSAHMYGKVGATMVATPIAEFVAYAQSRPKDWNHAGGHKGWISDLQVHGGVAIATVEERDYEGRDFRDIFLLVKDGDAWKIATKAFERVRST